MTLASKVAGLYRNVSTHQKSVEGLAQAVLRGMWWVARACRPGQDIFKRDLVQIEGWVEPALRGQTQRPICPMTLGMQPDAFHSAVVSMADFAEQHGLGNTDRAATWLELAMRSLSRIYQHERASLGHSADKLREECDRGLLSVMFEHHVVQGPKPDKQPSPKTPWLKVRKPKNKKGRK